ncbi:hypothetical protein ACFQYP_41790 [Nonomuraea antimicrobica]
MISGHGDLVAVRITRAVNIGVAGVVSIWHFGYHGSKLITHWSDYQSQATTLASWTALAVIDVIGSVALLRRQSHAALARTLAVAILVVGSIGTAAGPPGGAIADSSWAWSSVGWLGVLVLLRRPIVELGVLLTANLGVTAAFLALDNAFDEPMIMRFVTVTCIAVGANVIVALAGRLMQEAAQQTTEIAEAEVESYAHKQAADEVHARRQERYEYLRGQVESVLRGLADGTLDPADPAVQRRCAIEAARLRRLFAENDDVPNPLLHELLTCVDIAERRQVEVDLSTLGDLPSIPIAIRRGLTETPLAVLATAVSSARVTVVSNRDEVIVSIVADAPPMPRSPGPPAPLCPQSAIGKEPIYGWKHAGSARHR